MRASDRQTGGQVRQEVKEDERRKTRRKSGRAKEAPRADSCCLTKEGNQKRYGPKTEGPRIAHQDESGQLRRIKGKAAEGPIKEKS